MPVSDHVIRYALSLVRQTRVREPGVPDFVGEQIGWGAGPRAVQFLILGAKARALLQGRTHVTCEDIQALAKPVLRHRLVLSFTAESEGVTPDDVDRPDLDDHPHPRRRTDQRCTIPKDFCILRRSSGSRGSISAPGTSSKGFSRACTAVRTSASRSSSASTANTPPATTCATSTGRSGPSRTATTSSSSRKTPTSAARCWSTFRAACVTAAGPMNKYEYGCTIAVSLAYLLLRQQDAVGCVAFDDAARMTVPLRTKRNHLDSIIQALELASPAATRPNCTKSCATWPRAIPRRGMMVLISDLLVDAPGLFRGLRLLRSRGHDVMVFHVLDDDELDFPFNGPTRFEGLELPEQLRCNPRALREGYLAALAEYLEEVRRGCAGTTSTTPCCAPASRWTPRWPRS